MFGRSNTTIKQPRQILFVTLLTMVLAGSAYANAGPAILLAFSFHLVYLTWMIGIGESILLAMLFRTWKFKIYVYMIAANVASAWLGMLFVNSGYAAQFMGDVTIENLMPTFWNMVYVTFFLTMIIEFPFFLAALYGRKWLLPKAVAATIFVHCISYSLLFFFYSGEKSMNLVTDLEVVPVSAFEMEEEYDLYYISPDGKHVMRSNLTGNHTEVIATLDMDGVPDRLCACPRKVIEEITETRDSKQRKPIQRVCWESGFDLSVLVKVRGKGEKKLLLENFSPCAAVVLRNEEYQERCDVATAASYVDTAMDFSYFRSFGNAGNWEFESDYWASLTVSSIKQGYEPYSNYTGEKFVSIVNYIVHTPFVQWRIRSGSHIAGDYGVFNLGEDQICILDPAKKRIALIARGFGPVVAKPPLEASPEAVKE